MTEREETVCFFGYSDDFDPDGVRLAEFTKLETEDIVRAACAVSGKTFDPEVFEEYWREAQERKRRFYALRGVH